MNNYNRIEASSNIKNYWRVLRMYVLEKHDRFFNESDIKDMRNVKCSIKSRKA